MRLDGIHHITAITADGSANVEFYARVLGLRLVKVTVNQDDPTAYHLFYADEQGSHGADLTFFEYPESPRGRAGAGMVHRIVHRVSSAAALDFWEQRLGREGVAIERDSRALRFADPEGLDHALVAVERTDAPLIARASEVPAEHALQGFEAVHVFVADRGPSEKLVRDALGFQEIVSHEWEARGEHRGGRVVFEPARSNGVAGAGTVHHVAWATTHEDQLPWREQVRAAGARPTSVIDRFYFRSVYFREPGGILYELATIGPGFAVDEPAEHLGERLSLPPDYEHLRPRLEGILRPLPDARQWRPTPSPASAAQ
ncbi:MAG: VOC family protein [Solirubrobacteraceae bacterium]|nr:MAG: glyoxalase [Solirubrobacterales bacterium]